MLRLKCLRADQAPAREHQRRNVASNVSVARK